MQVSTNVFCGKDYHKFINDLSRSPLARRINGFSTQQQLSGFAKVVEKLAPRLPACLAGLAERYLQHQYTYLKVNSMVQDVFKPLSAMSVKNVDTEAVRNSLGVALGKYQVAYQRIHASPEPSHEELLDTPMFASFVGYLASLELVGQSQTVDTILNKLDEYMTMHYNSTYDAHNEQPIDGSFISQGSTRYDIHILFVNGNMPTPTEWAKTYA